MVGVVASGDSVRKVSVEDQKGTRMTADEIRNIQAYRNVQGEISGLSEVVRFLQEIAAQLAEIKELLAVFPIEDPGPGYLDRKPRT